MDSGQTAYIPRDFDPQLRSALEASTAGGGFIVLVGKSSVGKTRSLYEAILAVLPDWPLVQPANGVALRALTDAAASRTVLWLDELQRYFGVWTAAKVHALRRSGTVVVGTIWPDEYLTRIAPPVSGSADSFAHDRELLKMAQICDVPDELTERERGDADRLAREDRRIQAALRQADSGVIQVLAAGPALVRWWEQAPNPLARAVITAAVDARRLGMHSPVTAGFLSDAAAGYLTSAQRAKAKIGWLEAAIAYATTELHGAASVLVPAAGDMGVTVGYTVADYVLQHARRLRREDCPPATASGLLTWCESRCDVPA